MENAPIVSSQESGSESQEINAGLIRGILIENGIDPKNYSNEQYESAANELKKIQEVADNESLAKELATDLVKATADIAVVPALITASLLEAIGNLPLQDRSSWAQRKKPQPFDAVMDTYENLRKIFDVPGRKRLRELKKLGSNEN